MAYLLFIKIWSKMSYCSNLALHTPLKATVGIWAYGNLNQIQQEKKDIPVGKRLF